MYSKAEARKSRERHKKFFEYIFFPLKKVGRRFIQICFLGSADLARVRKVCEKM